MSIQLQVPETQKAEKQVGRITLLWISKIYTVINYSRYRVHALPPVDYKEKEEIEGEPVDQKKLKR